MLLRTFLSLLKKICIEIPDKFSILSQKEYKEGHSLQDHKLNQSEYFKISFVVGQKDLHCTKKATKIIQLWKICLVGEDSLVVLNALWHIIVFLSLLEMRICFEMDSPLQIGGIETGSMYGQYVQGI